MRKMCAGGKSKHAREIGKIQAKKIDDFGFYG